MFRKSCEIVLHERRFQKINFIISKQLRMYLDFFESNYEKRSSKINLLLKIKIIT